MSSLTVINIVSDVVFMAYGLKMPTTAGWQQPSGSPAGEHYPRGLQPADMVAIPSCIPPLFFPQNPQKYHQKSCDTIGQGFSDFMHNMLDAVAFAHGMWKKQAKFKDLKIAAVSAIGMPGCLDGPGLESLIKYAPTAATMSGQMAKWRDAVAAGVATCFSDYQSYTTVPGLPWYPAFAAFPGPMAPPMPNVPMPLIACISPGALRICVPMSLSSEMEGALDGGIKQNDPDGHYKACFMGIATVLSLAFVIWLPTQQVTLVMGKGPIPTFAPPFVPVGPVVGGDNIPTPGHVAP